MTYLIVQIFILLLIAGLLGAIFGWYLTRIAANSARASLQARLRNAEKDARELRTELDALALAKSNCDNERRLLSDELADLRARQDTRPDDAAHAGALAKLQSELDQCREALVAGAGSAADKSEQEVDSAAIAGAAASAASGARGLMGASAAAPTPAEDTAGADDLRRIKGIGPKIAGILADLGIRRFDQIAAWSPENVDWINAHLKFKGRVEREQWIAQARALISDRET